MSINTLIWGFSCNFTKVIDALVEENAITPKFWLTRIRERRRDYTVLKERNILYDGDFYSLKYTRKYADEMTEYTKAVDFNPEVYNKVYEKLYVFIDQYSRNDMKWQKHGIHYYINQFNLFYHFFYGVFVKERIQLVLFSTPPHFGCELIIYEIAKALNIKTILLCQSPLPPKFFYLDSIEDYGDFHFMSQQGENAKIKLEKKFFHDHFYMWNLKKYRWSLWDTIRESLKRPHEFFEHLAYNYLRYLRAKRYEKNISQLVRPVDYNKKYVYFPLHLQPELTTSALGGVFCDQILALELLSKKIPKDWVIYVKENPKQGEFMRNDSFFARLKLIGNLQMTPPEESTFKLIEHAQFVATITGTAGWEAICGGKPALVFGKAWYQNFEGVFKWDDELNIQEITNFSIDHAKLEKDYNLLVSKMAHGTVATDYICDMKNYNEDKNIQSIAEFLAKLINQCDEEAISPYQTQKAA